MKSHRITWLYLIIAISSALHLPDRAASLPLPDEAPILPSKSPDEGNYGAVTSGLLKIP